MAGYKFNKLINKYSQKQSYKLSTVSHMTLITLLSQIRLTLKESEHLNLKESKTDLPNIKTGKNAPFHLVQNINPLAPTPFLPLIHDLSDKLHWNLIPIYMISFHR